MAFKEPPIIISVGGSLMAPSGTINTEFLKQLNEFVRDYVKQGKRFFLVAGGGSFARLYRDAGKNVIGTLTNEDLDWLAIHATHLNGHLLRTIFHDIANPRIIQNYDHKLKKWKEAVVVGAGWKPGWSTDYDAVVLARDYGAQTIINLSNIDWVYDKDPNKYKDAKPIKKITWDEMKRIVNELLDKNDGKWIPGLNAPFDPIATGLAKKLGLTVIVANGTDFNNLRKIMDDEVFKGTVIMPFRVDASYYDREYYTGKKDESRFNLKESVLGKFVHSAVYFYRALLIKLLINPKNCLDVGCGTGGLVKALRGFGIDAYGVEISKAALELAPQEVKPFLKEADITKLPYPDNQFDLVLTFDVLEHMEKSKIRPAVDETIRVSKKFVLHKIYSVENHWINIFHRRDYSHLSVLTKKYWQSLFYNHKDVALLRGSFFKLPTFFESIFLLKKKT